MLYEVITGSADQISRYLPRFRPRRNLVCIYAHSGTYGTSSVPTGAPLVTSIYKNMSELTTTQTTTKFEFPKPYKTTNGTNYCLVLHCIGQTSGNTVAFGIDSTPSHGGNYALLQDQYSAWVVNTAYDMVFIVNSVTFSLVKLSSRITSYNVCYTKLLRMVVCVR